MITSDYLLGVTTAIIAMVVYTVYKTLTLPKRTRENIPVEGDPNDPIKIFVFPHSKSLLNASGPCAKIIAFLRLTGMPHTEEYQSNPGSGPKQKMPYMCHGTTVVGDSSFIIKYLVRTYGAGKDVLGKLRLKLSAEEQALATVVASHVDSVMYHDVLYLRWFNPNIAQVEALRQAFGPGLPKLIMRFLRVGMESWLWGYGLLRHSHDDIVAMACEHVDALDVLLAGKQFTLGNELTLVDCSVFSAVHGLLHMPVDHAGLQEYAKSKPNLVAYEKRVAALVL